MKKYFGLVFIALLIACTKEQVTKQVMNDKIPQQLPDTLRKLNVNTKMAYIPGGEYKPFYSSDTGLVTVHPFLMDERPVTNSEFLAFVKANPQWQRSKIKQIYADSSYLRTWLSDTAYAADALPDAPVCNVSWYAANAFAQSVNKRLPTLDEWEFVAMADRTSKDARKKPEYSDAIIDLYLQKDRQFQPVAKSTPNYWGVYNMFDLIWEWTEDFNSVLTTGESRGGKYEDKSLFCAGSATTSTDLLNYAAFMRFSLRSSVKAHYTIANLGFRCARDTMIVKK
ncbi:MAG TPA: formylglycine-generating enzyme family protein [Saprospiraceae bacterium]|nr:formylglycine-generating enzyme family protein [Saprospiraceae bacterium]HMX86404.1 formylglycine-generating enzyme family protein [Saprospiraceae bacterium]HNG07132.1 formylglycine-generating enzyme family protein [Saprospiraceae bacterium]